MTTTATTETPYRTNAAGLRRGSFTWSRRVRLVIVVVLIVMLVPAGFAIYRILANRRGEIAVANSTLEAKRFQREAVAWRSTHPLSCPTLADIGESPMAADVWNTGYAIECTATTTTVRSAGPDRTYFTADDLRYPK